MKTKIIDQYKYNGRLYPSADDVLAVLRQQNKIAGSVTIDNLPTQHDWLVKFWRDLGVDWEQLEISADTNALEARKQAAYKLIDQCCQNQINNNTRTVVIDGIELPATKSMFDKLMIFANSTCFDSANDVVIDYQISMTADQIDRAIAAIADTLVSIYHRYIQYHDQVVNALTDIQVNDIVVAVREAN